MIVILNNGTRIKIPKESVQTIFKALLESRDNAQRWHCFISSIDGSDQLRGFNMQQVAAICQEEDIITDPTGRLERLGAIVEKGLL